MKNSRNKQFINFRLCAILSSMMKSHIDHKVSIKLLVMHRQKVNRSLTLCHNAYCQSFLHTGILSSLIITRSEYNTVRYSRPLSAGNIFQAPQWMPETVDNTKPMIHIFSYTCTPFHLKKAFYGFSLAHLDC